jgi:hypothetical protein
MSFFKKNIFFFLLLLGFMILGEIILKPLVEGFGEEWGSIGNAAENLGNMAGDYAEGQTQDIFIPDTQTDGTPYRDRQSAYGGGKTPSGGSYGGGYSFNGGGQTDYPLSQMDFNNMEDEAHMRAQADNVAYIKTLVNPTPMDSIKIASFNPNIFSGDKTIYTGMTKYGRGTADYDLNDVANDIINKQPQQIKWDKIYIDTSRNRNNTLTLNRSPSLSTALVGNDACSTKGLFNSNFKKDICELTDNTELNKKCQELSPTNCKIPSCCVLLNGVSCVAGNINGPTYITRNGAQTDYYYYKNKCYGDGCKLPHSTGKACEKYVGTSTGISKECMVQMFNNYGCPNPQPEFLINDAMVQSYRLTTKKYVDNYIKTAVGVLKQQVDATSVENCTGAKGAPAPAAPKSKYASNPSWDAASQSADDALESLKFDN